MREGFERVRARSAVVALTVFSIDPERRGARTKRPPRPEHPMTQVGPRAAVVVRLLGSACQFLTPSLPLCSARTLAVLRRLPVRICCRGPPAVSVLWEVSLPPARTRPSPPLHPLSLAPAPGAFTLILLWNLFFQ